MDTPRPAWARRLLRWLRDRLASEPDLQGPTGSLLVVPEPSAFGGPRRRLAEDWRAVESDVGRVWSDLGRATRKTLPRATPHADAAP